LGLEVKRFDFGLKLHVLDFDQGTVCLKTMSLEDQVLSMLSNGTMQSCVVGWLWEVARKRDQFLLPIKQLPQVVQLLPPILQGSLFRSSLLLKFLFPLHQLYPGG
jgi:hypothetical protein